MQKNGIRLLLVAFTWPVLCALPAYTQQRQAESVGEPPPADLYQLVRPRFLFNGRFVQARDLPGGDIIMVAGATKEKDLVQVFTNKDEFLKWARQTEQGDALIRATEEMDKRAAEKAGNDSEESQSQQRQPEGAGGVTPMAGVGWLYNGKNYSGSPTRPLFSYPKLSWVNLDNKVSSVWTVGLTVLCDYTWYGGAKVFLLIIGIPDMDVFNFDNRASSVF